MAAADKVGQPLPLTVVKPQHLAVKHDFTTVGNSGTTTLNGGKSTATSIIE